MDCLDDIIGLRTGASNPGGVLFVNDLPGISLENINALADDEEQSFTQLWTNIKLRVKKKFEVIVKSKLNECYRLTDKTVVACLICEKKELFEVALWYLHGTELMIERTSSDEVNRWTTIDRPRAQELKADYYGEFLTCLNDAVQSISPSDSDCVTTCVECKSGINWVTTI